MNGNNWSTNPDNKITLVHRILSHLSLRVREGQFRLFWKLLEPQRGLKVLDVGTRADETLPDSNFFEKKYPFSRDLTAVSVEDCSSLKKKYPSIKFKRIKSGRPLPFLTQSFDIVVSWATIEHVGKRSEQEFFLKEIFRVGRKVFVATPNKNFFYDPHTNLFFTHWLPHVYFSRICRFLGKDFWAKEENLNPLNKKSITEILPKSKGARILSYKTFRVFSSHIIIVKINSYGDKK